MCDGGGYDLALGGYASRCTHMAATKQIKGSAVNDAGCINGACAMDTLHQAQEALEILPAIAFHPEHYNTAYRSHNDQEYDIIYYLQGGDMWHITECNEVVLDDMAYTL
jgi:hypothetical protein